MTQKDIELNTVFMLKSICEGVLGGVQVERLREQLSVSSDAFMLLASKKEDRKSSNDCGSPNDHRGVRLAEGWESIRELIFLVCMVKKSLAELEQIPIALKSK